MRLNSKFEEDALASINKKHKRYRLFYALYFKYYECYGDFFDATPKFSGSLISAVSNRLGVPISINKPSKKVLSQYRSEIRDYFQVSSKGKLYDELKTHLTEAVTSQGIDNTEELLDISKKFLVKNKLYSLNESYLLRLIKQVLWQCETMFFEQIERALDPESKAYLDGLMLISEELQTYFSIIKQPANGLSLESILSEAEKLKFLRQMKMPEFLREIPRKKLKKYYRYLVSKYPSAIKVMPESRRYAFLAIFCFIRTSDLNDILIDLVPFCGTF